MPQASAGRYVPQTPSRFVYTHFFTRNRTQRTIALRSAYLAGYKSFIKGSKNEPKANKVRTKIFDVSQSRTIPIATDRNGAMHE